MSIIHLHASVISKFSSSTSRRPDRDFMGAQLVNCFPPPLLTPPKLRTGRPDSTDLVCDVTLRRPSTVADTGSMLLRLDLCASIVGGDQYHFVQPSDIALPITTQHRSPPERASLAIDLSLLVVSNSLLRASRALSSSFISFSVLLCRVRIQKDISATALSPTAAELLLIDNEFTHTRLSGPVL